MIKIINQGCTKLYYTNMKFKSYIKFNNYFECFKQILGLNSDILPLDSIVILAIIVSKE